MGAKRIGGWGLAAFAGIVVVEHLLRADLPPADHFVSEYGVGSTRWLQSVAFVAWGVSMAAQATVTAVGHRVGTEVRSRSRRVAFGVAAACLAAAAAGCFVMAVFATQTIAGELPDGVARTTGGRLHDVGSLLVLAGLLLAAIATATGLRQRRHTLELALLAVALVAIVPVLVALGVDAPGWGQRGFIAVGCLWQALALRDLARRSSARAGRADRRLAG